MTRRRLDKELVRRGLASSRTEAVRLVEEGLVVVGGNPQPKAASQVDDQVSIKLVRQLHPYVGRGGVKLAAALDAFGVDVTGLRAIDLGASTGGFTDCLLQRGAASVTAVDVGYGQLDMSLRDDERVIVFDRTNIRVADTTELGAPFDVVVGDLSFISLCTLVDQLKGLGSTSAVWILLVKPQFEVGKQAIARGGLVRDATERRRAVEGVVSCLADRGLGARGLMRSPIHGAKSGNIEYLLLAGEGPPTVTSAVIESVCA